MLNQKIKQEIKNTFVKAFLPMCDKDGYIVGIFTANDIAETFCEILDTGLIKYTAFVFNKEITENFKPPRKEDIDELQSTIQPIIQNLYKAITERSTSLLLQANAELQFVVYKFIVKQNISKINTDIYKLYLEFKTKSITIDEFTNQITNILKSKK